MATAPFTYRAGLGRPLTYAEADNNFMRVEELHDEAEIAADAAILSASNAGTSETNAGNSAAIANTAATNASNSAASASTSATNAGNSASAASTSETNAGNSAASASQSAIDAANVAAGNVFDDAATLSNKGWTSQKIAAELATKGTVTLAGAQTLTNKTLGVGTKESVTTGAAISITDASAPFQHITLSGNVTASVSLGVGVSRSLWINPATFTVTWPTSIKWTDGEAPTLEASVWNLIEFVRSPVASGMNILAAKVGDMS